MTYRNKYRNQKVIYNGIKFDSKKEASRFAELMLMQRAGLIRDLERQKVFVLQDKYTNNKGEHVRAITYVADYYYWDCEKQMAVAEDVKSPITRQNPVYAIKKKMFEHIYTGIYFLETC